MGLVLSGRLDAIVDTTVVGNKRSRKRGSTESQLVPGRSGTSVKTLQVILPGTLVGRHPEMCVCSCWC